MKKLVALLLSLCLAFGMLAVASADAETKTGSAQGLASEVKVTVTVEDGKITAIDVDDKGETYPVAREDSVEKVIAAIIEANGTDGVDVSTGATFTCTAIVEAVNKALAESEDAAPAGDIAFTPGEYTATAYGYNGNVTATVTFSESKLEAIEITAGMETAHVGSDAFSIMIPDMLAANGTGVDVHTFGSIRLNDGSDDFFNAVFTGYRIGFSLVVHIEGSDLTVFNGNCHFYLAAEALSSTGLGFRVSRSHGQHAEEQAEGQEKSNKFLHGIPHHFL